MSTNLRNDEALRSALSEQHDENLLFADAHDNAILGVVTRCGQSPFVLYDRDKVVGNLMQDGMDEDEAHEFIDHNWNGWLGDFTPGILDPVE